MKTCAICKVEMELSEFDKVATTKDGYRYCCRSCKKNYDKDYHKKRKSDPKYKEYQRTYIANRRQYDPEGIMLARVKSRAKQLNIPFNLELSDIVIPEICPILEIPLITKVYNGEFGGNKNSPSLDRIVPELGYVKGNIRVISLQANMMKSNASQEELLIFAKNIIKLCVA